MENLIRYSESTENFLSCTSHQILAYLSSSGRKFGPKIGNFATFFKILQNFAFFEKKNFFSKFPNGLIRKVSMLKSKFDDIFVPAPLWGRPGSTLINFFEKKFRNRKKNFLIKVSKWSNSQSYYVKSEIWRYFCSSSIMRSPWLDT